MQNNIITILLGHHELQLHFNVTVNNTWPVKPQAMWPTAGKICSDVFIGTLAELKKWKVSS